MPYYKLEITARKTVYVKTDNPEDARHTAIMECTAMEWEEGEAVIAYQELKNAAADGDNCTLKKLKDAYEKSAGTSLDSENAIAVEPPTQDPNEEKK